MTTSIRRAALQCWLARAAELLEEQKKSTSSSRDSRARSAGKALRNRWDEGSVPEVLAGVWGAREASRDDAA